jgi:hypothetical protein
MKIMNPPSNSYDTVYYCRKPEAGSTAQQSANNKWVTDAFDRAVGHLHLSAPKPAPKPHDYGVAGLSDAQNAKLNEILRDATRGRIGDTTQYASLPALADKYAKLPSDELSGIARDALSSLRKDPKHYKQTSVQQFQLAFAELARRGINFG